MPFKEIKMNEEQNNTMVIVLNEEHMKLFIMELLSLKSGESWRYKTLDGSVRIHFAGNNMEIQKAIYNWLNVSERKQNFM